MLLLKGGFNDRMKGLFYPLANLSTYDPSFYLPACLIHLSIYLSIMYLFLYLSIYLSIRLSIYLYLLTCPSIYVSVYLSNQSRVLAAHD